MSDDEVPSTTEELYKYMQENTKGGHYGFVEQHSTAYYAAGWLHAFGGYILNENGEPGLDDENTIKALEYHKKFVELMPTEGEYSTVNTLFREGKAHSTNRWSLAWFLRRARAVLTSALHRCLL